MGLAPVSEGCRNKDWFASNDTGVIARDSHESGEESGPVADSGNPDTALDGDADGFTVGEGDCDDDNAEVNPDRSEVCNGIDDDCDEAVDEGIEVSIWCADTDTDGYGSDADQVESCVEPPGYSEQCSDCDDLDAAVHPTAVEYCDEIDQDCDGETRDGDSVDAFDWYEDADNDEFGNASSTRSDCDQPEDFIADSSDCDDTDPTVNPSATESCNSVDDDCDGSTDEGLTTTFFADGDTDGFGDASNSIEACNRPSGYVLDSTDCADTDESIYPGAPEDCNSADDDCDSFVDEGVTSTYYADSDNDGFGDPLNTVESCSRPSGYVNDDSDCDDSDAGVYPGASETCDGVDNDCNGESDDGVTNAYYYDGDSDGYGDAAISTYACSAPAGYVANNLDCDDADAGANPSATESCDGSDTDCDSHVDEGC